MERKELIRTIYLYLFSIVGLVLVVIGLVKLIDLGLKSYIFTSAEQYIRYPEYGMVKPVSAPGMETTELTEEEMAEYRAAQEEAERLQRQSTRARTASNAIALLIVGVPLFLYHWKNIQEDKRSR